MTINYDNLNGLDFTPEAIISNLFITGNRVPYVEINAENRKEVYPVHSEEIKNLITKAVYETTGRPPSRDRREEIITIMAAEAMYRGEEQIVWTRLAEIESGLEIDLNNDTGQCVKITADGWSIETPVSSFFRPASSRALRVPVAGADWKIFQRHFKTKTEDDLRLIIGFLLASLRPHGPYPILVLQGEQGSAKSTTARMLKEITDPSMGSTRGLIRREHDLFIAAKNNHLISFDNVSLVNNDLSDALCRLATGGSFSARTLYTNDSETLIELCKPVLLNGITDFVTRPDLASRSIIIELAPIPETERKTMGQVMAEFYRDLPQMLGVLMNGLSSATRNRDSVTLERLPRMADIVLWCTAAEEGLGWEAGSFSRALEGNQLNAILTHLSTDPVAVALRSFMIYLERGRWTGTATDLLTELTRYRGDTVAPRAWPSTPNYLSQYLSRIAPNLRRVGLDFVGRDRTSNQRLLILEKLENFTEMNPAEGEYRRTWNNPLENRQTLTEGQAAILASLFDEFDDDHDEDDDNGNAS